MFLVPTVRTIVAAFSHTFCYLCNSSNSIDNLRRVNMEKQQLSSIKFCLWQKKWHHFFVLLFYLYLLLQSSLEYLVGKSKNRVFFGYHLPLSVLRVCIFILHFLLEPRKVVALCSVLPKLMHVLPIQITTMFWLNRLSPFSINDIGILIVLLRFIESICVVYRKTYKLFKIGLKFR